MEVFVNKPGHAITIIYNPVKLHWNDYAAFYSLFYSETNGNVFDVIVVAVAVANCVIA